MSFQGLIFWRMLQANQALAYAAAIKWLRSCNAAVLLDSGGVHALILLLCLTLMHCLLPILLPVSLVQFQNAHLTSFSISVRCVCTSPFSHAHLLVVFCSCTAMPASVLACLLLLFARTDFIVYTGAQPSTALLDCKPGIRLSMPEDLAAVAHGDATLNLQNFMHPVRVG